MMTPHKTANAAVKRPARKIAALKYTRGGAADLSAWDTKTELKRLFWLLPGPVFYALFRLAFLVPEFVESVYSRGFFPFVNSGISSLTGLLPFSLGEFLVYAFVLFTAAFLIFMIVRAVLAKHAWWQVAFRRTTALLCILSMIYALFTLLWGFNYARLPLADTLSLDASPAAVSELYATSDALISRANALRTNVPEDKNGIFSPAFSRDDIMRGAAQYYDTAERQTGLSVIGGRYGRVKPVLYSKGLSWAHISGVYFPFTGEANVNAKAPMLLFPATCLHELAHQRGFAREDEADFLAYFISTFADDVSVQYSGAMLALIRAMNALYSADSDLYFELRDKYSAGLERDLKNNRLFWARYESTVSETATQVNDAFLKANQQRDGVKSYGRMVDLLIGLWRNGGILPAGEEL